MIQRIAALVLLTLANCQAASLARFFEPSPSGYVARAHSQSIEVSSTGVRINGNTDRTPVSLKWRGASSGALTAVDPIGGVTNYLLGRDESQWRSGVSHYSRVEVRELYPNVDAAYYFQGERFEFDLRLRPGAHPNDLRFDLPGASRPVLEAGGNLAVEAGKQTYRIFAPRAYQLRNGLREMVESAYALDRRGGVRFRLGPYDRTRDLIIDPVVDFFTYLGGSGVDEIEAVGADAAGNVIVAGITSSMNFPGGGTAAAGSVSIFVTKLNPAGTSLLFTTILGSQTAAGYSYNSYYPDSVLALAVDSDGSIYVSGETTAPNFPTSSGAWQQNSTGGFLTKLDASGKMVYSTFLGPQSWQLTAPRVLVRSGIAYLAGTVSAPTFLGTSGALQRNIAGDQDLFALAIAADGSSPIFATAFGGSGNDSFSDMALDPNGNLVLLGSSNSPDLPLTSDALPYQPPAANNSEAVLVRIDPTGSRLISSTWLGMSSAEAITALPDGGAAIAGGSTLPPDLIGGAPHYSINLTNITAHSYVAKFPAGSNRPAWSTDLTGGGFFWGISADQQGNVYWTGFPYTTSGGAVEFASGLGISKLSADGSRMLYASTVPGSNSFLAGVAGSGGLVYLASYTASNSLPTTPGVVQPQPDPAPPGTTAAPLNANDGFIAVLDLSSFTAGNFFVVSASDGLALTWRIGEPSPASINQAILTSGDPGTLTVTPSSRLTASYSTAPSPGVSINANTAQTATGSFQESVIIQSQSNTNAVLALPVALTVQPQVSFTLATYQVNIEHRQGQQQPITTDAITTNFGTEYFSFNVASSASWLYGNVSQFEGQPITLQITAATQPPGTYDGTLTISLQGLQNANQAVHVHLVIDPPATIQLSSTTISLHVVKGQPITPAVVTVTGSVPGVQWSVFVGVSATWLQVTGTTTTTPGQILVSVDPATVQVGIWGFAMLVTGENNQQIEAAIRVDVSSGAPFDVTPSSIGYQYTRGFSQYQNQGLTFTAPSPVTVQLKTAQTWMTLSQSSVTTPGGMGVIFDTTAPEGIYNGSISAILGSTTVTIPVTYTLYDLPHLVFSTSPIAFQWQVGDPPPPAQQLSIACPTLNPDYFQSGATSFPTFLQVNQSSGHTPATVTVAVDPTGLAPGTYKTSLAITASYPDSTAYPWIPVTLTVTADPNAPKATLSSVVDAASYLAGAVAPGEAVVLFGSGLGPSLLDQAQLGADGRYDSTLAGWTVYFDNVPAPVLYLSDKQSAVMAPFGIAGRATTNVTVVTGGTTSVAVPVPVAATNPSIFTANASGAGIAAAVNVAADGSISAHTPSSPAPPGGIVTVYVSGMGASTPAMPDGSLAMAPLPQLNASVRVLVGGTAADVLYAGPAPGEIAGLTQINIRIPQNASAGAVPLLVIAGGNPSQAGVTLSIQ
jgi:uncharacterized protein (TIGR03437 family)